MRHVAQRRDVLTLLVIICYDLNSISSTTGGVSYASKRGYTLSRGGLGHAATQGKTPALKKLGVRINHVAEGRTGLFQ